MTTIIGGSSPSITFSDSTTQTTAFTSTPSVTSITTSGDASINGLTVGKGGGAVGTNTAVGVTALAATNTGNSVTAVGYQAANANTSGVSNVAIGTFALNFNTSGGYNTAVGSGRLGNDFGALGNNTTGSNNSAFGTNALQSNTTSSNNVALGYQAMYSYQTGGDNVAVGSQAGYTINGNGNSVFVGRSAGQNATGGNQTLVGYQAGANISTGTTNLCLGYQAGANATNLTTGTQNILIGYQTNPSAGGVNYEIVMTTRGGSGKGTTTGYIDPQGGGVYQGNNSAAWSVASDRRLKKNIVDNTEGLSIISQIRVRNFEYRMAEEVTELPTNQAIQKQGIQLGVIAQELQEVCSDCVKEESTGVMSVNSDNITWHMVNAIKDLKALVDAQAAEIAELKAKVG